MNEHTPGPWRYSRTMRLVGHGVAAPWVCQVEDQGVPRERFEANVHLITAAPDLLAALRGLVTLYDDDEGCSALNQITAARAAIAKAEGATP